MKSNLQTYDLPQNDQTEKASREDSIKTNNEPSLINQIITSSTGETESLFEEFNDHYDPNELCDFSFGNCDEFFDYSTSY
ncbi:hypothetical protein TRFO_12364 [Tritrichomonas foetus]|uniref:Uncharacterized protein n=1 Tax=Tritrichomonas foetus TaxID=1144522 RepID=A0A1J4L1L7_9EUKA|nr:hypothetical protein TRFO_12364 [Tritrichomonas foetus]|eukprot:OHT17409.1 hypothetical protein TRFO_12364 [Tritrichomonas foetus]